MGNKFGCSFRRDPVTFILTPTEEPIEVTIDLETIQYHVMVASGPLGDDGFIRQHYNQTLTADPVSFPDLPQ